MTFQKIIAPKNIIVLTCIAVILGTASFLFFKTYFAHANTPFVVDSNLDTTDAVPGDGTCDDGAGHCTLRAAIQESNALAGADVINFAIAGGGPHVITPTSSFSIDDTVTIDATTQAGTDCDFAGPRVLQIEIDFSSLGSLDSGFLLQAGSEGSEIRGLSMGNKTGSNGAAILVNSSGTFQCNNIGVDASGAVATPNGFTGISPQNTTGAIIVGGFLDTGEGNILSNNDGGGISGDHADDVTIQGNLIGVALDGTTAMPNGRGVGFAVCDTITIGGSTAGQGNVISGNTTIGIELYTVTNLIISGNAIGIGLDGVTAVPNDGSGIYIQDGSWITIGGSIAGGDVSNIIGANGVAGVQLDTVNEITIKNNYIGLGNDGTTYLTNTVHGIIVNSFFGDSSNITIGGSIIGGGSNYFASNDRPSLQIASGDTGGFVISDIQILGNYFGIDTAGDFTAGTNGGIVLHGVDTLDYGDGTADHRNYFAGPSTFAIYNGTDGAPSANINIKGNYFGVDPTGNPVAGYGNSDGLAEIFIMGGDANQNIVIGGTTGLTSGGACTGDCNIISGTTSPFGIEVAQTAAALEVFTGTSTGIAILGNSIFGNVYGGIDFAEDTLGDFSFASGTGPNTNDITDTDTGPNNLLNHPVIQKVDTTTGIVTYSVDVPAGDYHVEFFTNPSNGLGALFLGEGEVYEAADDFTVATDGIITRTKTISLSPGDVVTATITEDLGGGSYGSTSEFSNSSPFGIDMGTASGETLMSANGAYHILTDSYLGSCANSDLGDGSINDTNGSVQSGAFIGTGPCTNDTDGVTFDHTSYTINTTITSTVTASADGFIHIWLDNNHDGDFDDSGEHVIDDQAVSTGSNTVTFSAPPVASTHYARFRFTTTDYPSLAPQGEAIGGEVEDYALTITDASGGGGGGGCTSNCGTSGTQFACKDPLATNYYTGSAVSKPSLCLYGTTQPPLIPTNPTPDVCPVFTKYYRKGDTGGEIPKIQSFLNKELGIHLSPDGIYGTNTANAVGMFQQKYTDYILKPWHPPFSLTPTKRWYKTTAGTANIIAGCPSPSVILEDNGVNWTFSDAVKRWLGR